MRARSTGRRDRGGRRSGSRGRCYPANPSRKKLLEQVEQLQRENERLREHVRERDQQIAEKNEQIAEKNEQIAELQRQLAARKQNSTNSSKPPSSDGLGRAAETGTAEEEQ